MGAAAENACLAHAGYTGSGRNVSACASGTYKSEHSSAAPCTECPCNSLTYGQASLAQTSCHCGLGHTRSLLGVQAAGTCPVGYTDPLGGASETTCCMMCGLNHFQNITGSNNTCHQCAPHSSSDNGANSSDSCLCDKGYSGPNGGPCEACNVTQFKDTEGDRPCSPCPLNMGGAGGRLAAKPPVRRVEP